MFAAAHFTDADSVLRTLIVGLGGFATVTALLLAVQNLVASRRTTNGASVASLLIGLVLLSFAGLAGLTTDHIYRHLLADEAAAWQLWLSLASYTVGVPALLALLGVRFDRGSVPKP